MRVCKSILFVSSAIVLSSAAIAQDTQSETSSFVIVNENEGSDIEFAYGVPSSPALAIAGLKASDVTKINEVQKFALSVPSALNGDGDTAIAIDLRPALFVTDRAFDYTKDNLVRKWVQRSVVSLAIQEGKSDSDDPDKSTRSLLSLGLSASLLNSSDPLHVLFDDGEGSVKRACRDAYSSELRSFLEDTGQSTQVGEQVTVLVNRARARARYIEIEDSNAGQIPTPDDLLEADRFLRSARSLIVENLGEDQSLQASNVPPEFFDSPYDYLADRTNLIRVTEGITADIAAIEAVLRDKNNVEVFVALTNDELARREAELQSKSKECSDAITEVVKFAPNLDLGFGALWRGKDAALGDFETGGSALWASYRYPAPLGRAENGNPQSYLVAGVSGRFGWDEFVSTGDESLGEAQADTAQIWGGIEYVSSNWRGNARIGYVETDFNSTEASPFSSDGEKWLVGADIRLGRNSNTWLGIEYGEAGGTIDALRGETLKVSFKFSDPAVLNLFALPD